MTNQIKQLASNSKTCLISADKSVCIKGNIADVLTHLELIMINLLRGGVTEEVLRFCIEEALKNKDDSKKNNEEVNKLNKKINQLDEAIKKLEKIFAELIGGKDE